MLVKSDIAQFAPGAACRGAIGQLLSAVGDLWPLTVQNLTLTPKMNAVWIVPMALTSILLGLRVGRTESRAAAKIFLACASFPAPTSRCRLG